MVLRALLAVAPGDAHSGGADLRARDAQGRTALHRAAARGQTRCVELLLEADGGPDLVDMQDARGRTALHEAAARAHVTAAIRLLNGGASPALRDALGRTARDEVSAAAKRAKGAKNAARLTLLDMTMMLQNDPLR
ncbi:Ankyrin-2 [Gryllus bimaculatus]|nr:Ankyrin-2 [Gryllus bimaculatus]